MKFAFNLRDLAILLLLEGATITATFYSLGGGIG